MSLSLVSRAKEALFGAPETPGIAKGVAVFSSTEQAIGVRPSTSFANQLQVYLEDPVIKEAVLQFAQEVISTGYFTTFNESYKLRLPTGPGNREWDAKEAINYWCKQNNLDEKILHIAVELVGFGNSFWNITDGGFSYVPLEGVDHASAADKTKSIREKYKIHLTSAYGAKVLEPGEFLHFHTEPIGNGPMGSGIILGLIATPDAITDANDNSLSVPSLYDVRKAFRASMKAGFCKFSFGNELWSFPGLPDGTPAEGETPATGMYAVLEKLNSMPSTGERVATNVPGKIDIAVPQRTQSYDKWIDQNEMEFLMALSNPSLKLGLQPGGYTKATAQAARELYEMKISSMRRIIKRQIEALWAQVLIKAGFDGEEANVRLNFGSPEIEYATTDIATMVNLGVIDKNEARHLLMKNMKWDIPEKP